MKKITTLQAKTFNLFDQNVKREIYAILNKQYRNECQTAKLFITIDHYSNNFIAASLGLMGTYNYLTKEDLAKQIINDDNHYYSDSDHFKTGHGITKLFVGNFKLVKLWQQKYIFIDPELIKITIELYKTDNPLRKQSFDIYYNGIQFEVETFENFYKNILTKRVINKLYQEVGYENLIEDLISLNGKETHDSGDDCHSQHREYYMTLNDGETDRLKQKRMRRNYLIK